MGTGDVPDAVDGCLAAEALIHFGDAAAIVGGYDWSDNYAIENSSGVISNIGNLQTSDFGHALEVNFTHPNMRGTLILRIPLAIDP